MNTELDIQDANGNTITTIELFPDVLDRMTLEAALRGVSVGAHCVGIITDAARRIVEDTENTLPNHCQICGAWGTSEIHLTGCENKEAA